MSQLSLKWPSLKTGGSGPAKRRHLSIRKSAGTRIKTNHLQTFNLHFGALFWAAQRFCSIANGMSSFVNVTLSQYSLTEHIKEDKWSSCNLVPTALCHVQTSLLNLMSEPSLFDILLRSSTWPSDLYRNLSGFNQKLFCLRRLQKCDHGY